MMPNVKLLYKHATFAQQLLGLCRNPRKRTAFDLRQFWRSSGRPFGKKGPRQES
jgi:hypothetical protein